MSFQLRILPRAERDIQNIFDYIQERSPDGARKWWEALCRESERVSLAPWEFPAAYEHGISAVELQQFLFKTRRGRTYRAVFAVISEEILILRVRGPGQAPLMPDELPSTE